MKTTGNTILVTGGGSGIGLCIVRELLQRDNKVMICGRNEEKLKAACEANPGLTYYRCDVVNDNDVESMLAKIDAEHGKLDVLINNAAVFLAYDFYDDPDTLGKIEREITINLIGPLKMMHRALPLLEKGQQKTMAFVTSGLAYVPLKITPIYSSTKAALHFTCHTLRRQLEPRGFKIFELMPPFTDTPMTKNFDSKKVKKALPEDVAAEFIKALEHDKYEILVGQSKSLSLISRLAPNFIEKQLADAFS